MQRRGLIVGAVVAVVVIGGIGSAVTVGPLKSKPVHAFSISFPTGDGLVPGSDVFEAGSKIGTISSIEPQAEADPTFTGAGSSGDRAIVTVSIEDDHWPLHDGLTAGIRPKSLLGEKYVDLHDAGTRTYDTGRVLSAPADSVPVELDQFINSLDAPTRTAAKVLLDDLGAGIAGRGGDLNTAIATGRENLAHLATFGQTLNNRDPDLDRIIVGLDGVLSKITQDDQLTQLSQLIDNGQKTLNAIEAEQQSYSRSFTDAQVALRDLNTALDPAIQSLRDTINTAPHLLSTLGTEGALLASLAQDIQSGNTLQIFKDALAGGSTVSGGALEKTPDGHLYPIFRVCVEQGQQSPTGGTSPAAQGSCMGNGFKPPQSSSSSSATATGARGGNGGVSIAALVGFLGA